jgi:adenosine deaminase
MDFAPLPKIELHLHLDCSLSFEIVSRLNPAVTLAEYQNDFIAPAKCTNLADFLTRAPKGIQLMQTEHELRLVTADMFQQLQRDGVIYAEIRFAPLFHTEKGLSPEQVVEIVESATTQASETTGIEARLILCTLRHFSEEQSLQTAQLVKRFKGTRVAALDIAGDEAGFGIDKHRAAFQFAIDHNLYSTAHAGEAKGPESVWETLKHFRPSRIGHGVRSIEEPDLLAHLKQQNIHLEVCPSCNVQIDIYNTYADHPIDRLYKAGVSVGVNTDARTIVNTTLTQEYERLHQTFGWGKEHFLRCNLNALHAAFLPDLIKQRLERRLVDAYNSLFK